MIMAILLMAGAVLAQEDATEQKDTLWTISGTTSLNLSQLHYITGQPAVIIALQGMRL